MSNRWLPRFLASLAMAIVAMVVCPEIASAQDRAVPVGLASCAQYGSAVFTVRLTRATDVSQILAASWNGASAEQAFAYLNQGTAFPSPVLPGGLPSFGYGGAFNSRDIGRGNWMRPGTDAAFQSAFRGQSGFVSLPDLVRANPARVWSANANVTETFERRLGETPPAPPLAGQRVILSRDQANVTAGYARWVFEATAQLSPNCVGRPARLFGTGSNPEATRRYLGTNCVPQNDTTLEQLFGYTMPAARYGGRVAVRFTVRANPGQVVIPRSTGYLSPVERACLALPRVATEADALRASSRDGLVARLNELAPSTVPGLSPDDVRAAAIAATGRIQGVLTQPMPADQARIDAALQSQRAAERVAAAATARAERLDGRLKAATATRGLALVLSLALIVALAATIFFGRRERVRKDDKLKLRALAIDGLTQQLADLEESIVLPLQMAGSIVDAIGRTGLRPDQVEDCRRLASKQGDGPSARMAYLHGVMSAVDGLLTDRNAFASPSVPPCVPADARDFVPTRLFDASVIAGVRRHSITPVPADVPSAAPPAPASPPAAPSSVEPVLHQFLGGIIDVLYPARVAESDPSVAEIRRRFEALGPETPKDEAEDLVRGVLTELSRRKSERQLRAHMMGELSEIVRQMAVERAPPWPKTKTCLVAVADMLAKPDQLKPQGYGFEPVIALFQRKTGGYAASDGRTRRHATPSRGEPVRLSRPG